MLTAMFILAIIALAFFAGAVAAAFKRRGQDTAVTALGLVSVLVLLALAVLTIVAFFVGA